MIESVACKMTVHDFENSQKGGLDVLRRCTLLQAARRNTPWLDRELRWTSWLDHAFLFQLQWARDTCREKNIRHQQFLEKLARDAPRPWTSAT